MYFPDATWYVSILVSSFLSCNKLSNAPEGSFANAASVGAKTVNGPGPLSVSTRSAACTAFTSVVKFSASIAVSTIFHFSVSPFLHKGCAATNSRQATIGQIPSFSKHSKETTSDGSHRFDGRIRHNDRSRYRLRLSKTQCMLATLQLSRRSPIEAATKRLLLTEQHNEI